MQIPLAFGSHSKKSRALNKSRCVNFYPMVGAMEVPAGDKYPVSYATTAGNTLFTTISTSPCRGAYSWNDLGYVVSGNTLYEISVSGVATSRGTLTSDSGVVKMRANPTQLMIINKGTTEGYIYTFSTTTLTAISDADYLGADDLEYQDGYFLVVKNGRIYFSELNAGLSWIATDVVTPTYQADTTRALATLKEDLIFFGDRTTEVYYNDGSTPFVRKPGHAITYGVGAVNSVLNVDDSIIFISTSYNGSGYIVKLNATFDIEAISTEALDYQLSTYGQISDAFAISYKEGRHLFYQITFPSVDKTWVYDLTTKMWHEKQSLKIDGATFGRHVANCYMYLKDQHIIGDYATGLLYKLDFTIFTENSNQLVGFIDSVALTDGLKRLRINSFEVDASHGKAPETGDTDPKFMLSTSKDNLDYGTEIWKSIGKLGEYTTRSRWLNLGIARTWSFRIKYAGDTNMEINGIVAHGMVGST